MQGCSKRNGQKNHLLIQFFTRTPHRYRVGASRRGARAKRAPSCRSQRQEKLMRIRTDCLIAGLIVAWVCAACAPVTEPEGVAHEQACIEVANGLKTINGLTGINGLIGINGLTADNGLTLISENEYALNGLSTARGQVVPCDADQQNTRGCAGMDRRDAQQLPPAFCAPDGLLSAKTGMMSTS